MVFRSRRFLRDLKTINETGNREHPLRIRRTGLNTWQFYYENNFLPGDEDITIVGDYVRRLTGHDSVLFKVTGDRTGYDTGEVEKLCKKYGIMFFRV